MGVIFLLIIISAFVAIVFLIAFLYAVKTGQFEDTETPAHRILLDDFETKSKEKSEN